MGGEGVVEELGVSLLCWSRLTFLSTSPNSILVIPRGPQLRGKAKRETVCTNEKKNCLPLCLLRRKPYGRQKGEAVCLNGKKFSFPFASSGANHMEDNRGRQCAQLKRDIAFSFGLQFCLFFPRGRKHKTVLTKLWQCFQFRVRK